MGALAGKRKVREGGEKSPPFFFAVTGSRLGAWRLNPVSGKAGRLSGKGWRLGAGRYKPAGEGWRVGACSNFRAMLLTLP